MRAAWSCSTIRVPLSGLTLLTLGYDLNTTDPAQLDEAKNKLAELVPGRQAV